MGLKARKEAEEAKKQRMNAEADAKKHLLVKMGADRNAREAYLYGLVFAGLANDDVAPEIQSEERAILNGICEALALEPSLIDEIVTTEKSSIDDDTYMGLLRECLGSFSDIKMYDSFLEDFVKVWSAGKGKPSELKGWQDDFEKMVSPDVAKVLAERQSAEAKRVAEEAKRKEEAEAKAMRLEQLRKEKRGAYFSGLVIAAVSNDGKIDESERARLLELAEDLELTADDAARAIQCLSGMDGKEQRGVIKMCARQLTNVEVAECFLKEFSELWLLGGGKEDEFGAIRSQLIDWMGDDVKSAEVKKDAEEAKHKAENAEA